VVIDGIGGGKETEIIGDDSDDDEPGDAGKDGDGWQMML
jgi:hypothetical protein